MIKKIKGILAFGLLLSATANADFRETSPRKFTSQDSAGGVWSLVSLGSQIPATFPTGFLLCGPENLFPLDLEFVSRQNPELKKKSLEINDSGQNCYTYSIVKFETPGNWIAQLRISTGEVLNFEIPVRENLYHRNHIPYFGFSRGKKMLQGWLHGRAASTDSNSTLLCYNSTIPVAKIQLLEGRKSILDYRHVSTGDFNQCIEISGQKLFPEPGGYEFKVSYTDGDIAFMTMIVKQ